MSEKLEILRTENINKSFDDKIILKDINIKLNKGELVSFVGVSGSGKTTLFNIIAGLLGPDSGKVFLRGKEITNKAGKVSYMLQKDLLLPYMTIIDNVSLPLVLRGDKKKVAREKVKDLFKDFGLEGNEYKYPSQLSGGMAQRAALLRTYVFGSEVTLLDEPFSALDAITKASIHKWYKNIINEMKISTIFITHDIEEAVKLSDRIYILGKNPGTIIDEINIKENFHDNFFEDENFIKYKKYIINKLDNL
ncbi:MULTISPECIES: ABC transporter ATP-binding protein [Peptoniphilus]|uniref:ABC transporter ATP-binding protein n=1 Tax=Peptoniphilus TaxID=162289 RepID=UPI002901816D|nr:MULTISPECIES: ABC transporter ATP-binding protein [Peptoniphilus]MBS6611528.1 ABC transporter ATP-binding protein [Peptoniphilus harei]MDU2115918.1 ABC transporter ATP-binding protein [Peptoniphilus lacydonensis]MDU3751052.1 ABC transporter ATP-binding protein [Peptoniphilus rhinitidis]MDU5378336.1 ABC transporter ATP-binding protein [Peptoniphilus lacydonensis]MDU5437718.1 ABC transporter ATP-binding protein [Peptoniphilus lacydonensis]